jgi:hypothetical protein
MSKPKKKQPSGRANTQTPCAGLRAAIEDTEQPIGAFADALGWSASRLSNWFAAGTAPLEDLELACKALGLTVEQVATAPDEDPAEKAFAAALVRLAEAQQAVTRAAKRLRRRYRSGQ